MNAIAPAPQEAIKNLKVILTLDDVQRMVNQLGTLPYNSVAQVIQLLQERVRQAAMEEAMRNAAPAAKAPPAPAKANGAAPAEIVAKHDNINAPAE